jgi:hypothetical protein
MARTLTPNTAISLLQLRYGRSLPDGFAVRFCDEVIGKMWHRYPWRETLEELPPFHLTHDEAYYGPPLLAVPSDFFSIHEAWLVSSSYEQWPLKWQKNVSPTMATDMPNKIGYDKARGAFVLSPRPSVSAPDWWVTGTYKKNATKLTNATLASYVLPWDDTYYDVFRAGLEWKFREEILRDKDWPLARQSFYAALSEMAMSEGLAEGDTVIIPEFGLELGG